MGKSRNSIYKLFITCSEYDNFYYMYKERMNGFCELLIERMSYFPLYNKWNQNRLMFSQKLFICIRGMRKGNER